MPPPRTKPCPICGEPCFVNSMIFHLKPCAQRKGVVLDACPYCKEVMPERMLANHTRGCRKAPPQDKPQIPEYEVDPETGMTGDGRVRCPVCGRKFGVERIRTHENICVKVHNRPPRIPYDSFIHRAVPGSMRVFNPGQNPEEIQRRKMLREFSMMTSRQLREIASLEREELRKQKSGFKPTRQRGATSRSKLTPPHPMRSNVVSSAPSSTRSSRLRSAAATRAASASSSRQRQSASLSLASTPGYTYRSPRGGRSPSATVTTRQRTPTTRSRSSTSGLRDFNFGPGGGSARMSNVTSPDNPLLGGWG